MTRIKSLLKQHKVVTAKRPRTCKNSGRSIMAGERVLEVCDNTYARSTYSREIALAMIAQARLVLADLEKDLSS